MEDAMTPTTKDFLDAVVDHQHSQLLAECVVSVAGKVALGGPIGPIRYKGEGVHNRALAYSEFFTQSLGFALLRTRDSFDKEVLPWWETILCGLVGGEGFIEAFFESVQKHAPMLMDASHWKPREPMPCRNYVPAETAVAVCRDMLDYSLGIETASFLAGEGPNYPRIGGIPRGIPGVVVSDQGGVFFRETLGLWPLSWNYVRGVGDTVKRTAQVFLPREKLGKEIKTNMRHWDTSYCSGFSLYVRAEEAGEPGDWFIVNHPTIPKVLVVLTEPKNTGATLLSLEMSGNFIRSEGTTYASSGNVLSWDIDDDVG